MSRPAPAMRARDYADPRADPNDRGKSPYSLGAKLARVLWAVVQATLFRYSFHNWYTLRRLLLVAFGAKLHPTVRIRRTARIEIPWNLTMGRDSSVGDRAILYCLGPITIGDRVSISQQAHLCAGSHDYTLRSMPLLRPPIVIEDDAWIAADAFVGPAVRVGQGAILGSRGCALRDLEPWTIYLGNPAQAVKPRPPFRDQEQAP
ncbi:MAG: acetyltransferase [Phycisphaerales bacterium]|nr:MAG: acetyltransferase [Phycisphaerales bacterium]